MLASIEWLQRGMIGIVRAGPICSRYSKPFEYAVAFQRTKYWPYQAVVKALVADGRFKRPHQKAILAKIGRHFPNITWKRYP